MTQARPILTLKKPPEAPKSAPSAAEQRAVAMGLPERPVKARVTPPTEPPKSGSNPKIARQWRMEMTKHILAEFQSRWPVVFNTDHPKPLARGVHEELFKEMPDMSKSRIRWALQRWTTHWKYHKALTRPCAVRFDLHGNPVEPVSEQDVETAKRRLSDITLKQHKKRERLRARENEKEKTQ